MQVSVAIQLTLASARHPVGACLLHRCVTSFWGLGTGERGAIIIQGSITGCSDQPRRENDADRISHQMGKHQEIHSTEKQSLATWQWKPSLDRGIHTYLSDLVEGLCLNSAREGRRKASRLDPSRVSDQMEAGHGRHLRVMSRGTGNPTTGRALRALTSRGHPPELSLVTSHFARFTVSKPRQKHLMSLPPFLQRCGCQLNASFTCVCDPS